MTIVSSSIRLRCECDPQAAFSLCLAEVPGRAANSCRGRFQRRPRRAIRAML